MNDMIEAAEAWSNNWVWGLPLIASTVLAHGVGLVLIQKYIVLRLPVGDHQSIVAFASVTVVAAIGRLWQLSAASMLPRGTPLTGRAIAASAGAQQDAA